MSKHTYILVPCEGCGHKVMVAYHKAVYTISAPQIACSNECLNRYEVSVRSFLEKQVYAEQTE